MPAREVILKDLLEVAEGKEELLKGAGGAANVQDMFGQTPVHWCVQHQVHDQSIMRRFVESKGVNLDAVDVDGATALMLAVKMGRPATVKLLVKEGADPNLVDNDGLSPLHIAAYQADRGSLDALLLSYELDVDPVDQHGLTPLHCSLSQFGLSTCTDAARNHHLYVIEALLRAKADLELRDGRGRSVVDQINALEAGKKRAAESAVKSGQKAAASAKPPPKKECPSCKQMCPQNAFRFIDWIKGGQCQACHQAALTSAPEVEEEMLYIPTELHDIADIIPTYEQYFQPGSLSMRLYKEKMRVDDDAGRAEGMPPFLDEIYLANEKMPFDKLAALLRSRNVNVPDAIFREKGAKNQQSALDGLYWRHCYRDAVGKMADGLVIMDIRDPKHPVAIHTPEGKQGYGLFLSENASPIPAGRIIGEYVGEVVDNHSIKEEDEHEDDNDDNVAIKELSGEEYLMAMDSTSNWFYKRGADRADQNQLHVNALKYRNHMAAINDFRGYAQEKEGASCFFREVTIDNWPHLFVTALREIKPGEELLADYGEQYWINQQDLKKEENKIKKKIETAEKIERTRVGDQLLVEVEWLQERHADIPPMQDLIMDFRAAVKRAVPSAGVDPIQSLTTTANLVKSKKARLETDAGSAGVNGAAPTAAAPRWKQTWMESEVRKSVDGPMKVVKSCPLCKMALADNVEFDLFAQAAECCP